MMCYQTEQTKKVKGGFKYAFFPTENALSGLFCDINCKRKILNINV